MSFVNWLLRGLFDLLLSPFQTLPPSLPLLLFSLLTAALMLITFGLTSDQEAIRETKRKMMAHFLEIRLFKDEFRILFSAQGKIALYSLKYLGCAVRPALWLLLPVTLLLLHLDGWFGYRPLRVGETAIVSIMTFDPSMNVLSQISIETSEGLVVETRPLRILERGQVDWRVRATQRGEQSVMVNVSGREFRKKIVTGDARLVRVSPRRIASGLWNTFWNPGEDPVDFPLRQIEVTYPSRSIKCLGWEMHWLTVFFLSTILFSFLLKPVFRVEI